MQNILSSRIESALEKRKEDGLYRSVTAHSRQSQFLKSSDGEAILDFSGNDYLGLASEPAVLTRWQQGLDLYGAGSTASPLVTGQSDAHSELQDKLCQWLGFERALLFCSGFAANQAVLFSLLQKGDWLVQDKLNHASLIEAGMLSPATLKRFAHNDTTRLDTMQASIPEGTASLVVTEGVFSMDGDCAPLSDISQICQKHNSWLMVDDAHGCGILGSQGRGSADAAAIKPDILVVTFGKAFGLMGAAVLCRRDVAEYLTQFARHYVYSTAMPPAQAYTLSGAIDLVAGQPWRREKLAELSSVFHQRLSGYSQVVETGTPIKPVVIGNAGETLGLADALRVSGYRVGAIRPPTVPPNTARLRITLSANHSIEQVSQLAMTLARILNKEQ